MSSPSRRMTMPETDPPRRRGRPPGARVTYALPPSEPLTELVAPEAVKVSISMKSQAFGERASDREVNWPAGWSLPRVGDLVQIEKGVGGFVAYLTFDLASGRIIVALR